MCCVSGDLSPLFELPAETFNNMTEKTTIRVTREELDTLAEASELMYGREREVARGAVIRRLAEEYIDEVSE